MSLDKGIEPRRNTRRGKGARLARVIAIVLASVIVLLYGLLPVGMGVFAAIRPAKACGAAPQGFTDVELKSTDGTPLQGWYAPGTNGKAILLLHGSKGNRDAVRNYAEMLRRNGFGVLAMDLRGHGMSGGRANAFGWECTQDVAAAADYLTSQPDVKAVGALGLSLGGEVLLGAASACPQITAIASEGASHRCTADYVSLPSNNSLFRSWTTRVMYWSVGLFTGCRQPASISDSIAAAPDTAFLLIAAGNSRKEIDYNTMFAKIAGSRAELWVAEGVGHIGAAAQYPDEYEKRITEFFGKALS